MEKKTPAKNNDLKKLQLSRQQISRQIIGQHFYLKQNVSLLKTGPGEIRNQDLCRPGIFVTSRLSWPGTHRRLNSL